MKKVLNYKPEKGPKLKNIWLHFEYSSYQPTISSAGSPIKRAAIIPRQAAICVALPKVPLI